MDVSNLKCVLGNVEEDKPTSAMAADGAPDFPFPVAGM